MDDSTGVTVCIWRAHHVQWPETISYPPPLSPPPPPGPVPRLRPHTCVFFTVPSPQARCSVYVGDCSLNLTAGVPLVRPTFAQQRSTACCPPQHAAFQRDSSAAAAAAATMQSQITLRCAAAGDG